MESQNFSYVNELINSELKIWQTEYKSEWQDFDWSAYYDEFNDPRYRRYRHFIIDSFSDKIYELKCCTPSGGILSFNGGQSKPSTFEDDIANFKEWIPIEIRY